MTDAAITDGDVAISIVVPTHNRADLLGRLMNALAAQEGASPFEVVVVDDASTDGTWAELERLARIAPFPLRPLRQDRNQGAAAARNRGWQAARASRIAFTDDDCVPDPGWLARVTAPLDEHDLVQGRTVPNPDHAAKSGPFSRSMYMTHEKGYYETCNMAYRREALTRVGGFDEAFRFPYGEDCDLAWRVKKAGGRSTFTSDAVVYHDVWPSDYRAYLRDKRRHEGLVHAMKKHPHLHEQRGYFDNGSHPAAIATVAAGAALLMRRDALTAVAAVGAGSIYTWNCRRNHGGPGRGRGKQHWLYLVPLHLVGDLVDIAVLARASIRHRTLFL